MDRKDKIPDEVMNEIMKNLMGGITSGRIKVGSIPIECDCPDCRDEQDELSDLTTIVAHYGVKEKDFTEWTYDMLKDLKMKDKISDVVDKWFSKFDNEDRVKIFAFIEAMENFEKTE